MNKNLLYLLLLVLISCNNKNDQEEIDFSTTEELQQQSSDVISYKRKRDRDIVKHLYGEAVDKDPNLKSLESQILKFNSMVQDSLVEFAEYVEYNNLYYQSAQNHIRSISDSIKRKNLLSYFSDSAEKLEIRIDEHKNVNKTISELTMELRDQHSIMKLIVSEKLINSYQNNEPDIKPLQSINEQIKNLISESEKYTTTKK